MSVQQNKEKRIIRTQAEFYNLIMDLQAQKSISHIDLSELRTHVAMYGMTSLAEVLEKNKEVTDIQLPNLDIRKFHLGGRQLRDAIRYKEAVQKMKHIASQNKMQLEEEALWRTSLEEDEDELLPFTPESPVRIDSEFLEFGEEQSKKSLHLTFRPRESDYQFIPTKNYLKTVAVKDRIVNLLVQLNQQKEEMIKEHEMQQPKAKNSRANRASSLQQRALITSKYAQLSEMHYGNKIKLMDKLINTLNDFIALGEFNNNRAPDMIYHFLDSQKFFFGNNRLHHLIEDYKERFKLLAETSSQRQIVSC